MKKFKLKKEVGVMTEIIIGTFLSEKNIIRIEHEIYNSKLRRKEKFEEIFEVKTNEKDHIITRENENGEYYDLNWNLKKFDLIDREGIIDGYFVIES